MPQVIIASLKSALDSRQQGAQAEEGVEKHYQLLHRLSAWGFYISGLAPPASCFNTPLKRWIHTWRYLVADKHPISSPQSSTSKQLATSNDPAVQLSSAVLLLVSCPESASPLLPPIDSLLEVFCRPYRVPPPLFRSSHSSAAARARTRWAVPAKRKQTGPAVRQISRPAFHSRFFQHKSTSSGSFTPHQTSMRMMYRSHSDLSPENRPASPPGKPGELVPDLQPLRMWPCRYAKAADSLGFLKTIERLEVHETVKHKGKVFYVVAVYLKNPENRIPTGRNSYCRKSSVMSMPETHRDSVTEPTTPTHKEPDYLVEHEFSEFVKLRYNIWVHAQQPRPATGCIYCDDITGFVGDASKRPSSLMEKLWATKSRRKELMEAYLNRIVLLAIGRGGDGQRSPHCHGFDHIPYRLVRFLKKAEITRLR